MESKKTRKESETKREKDVKWLEKKLEEGEKKR